MTPNPEVAILIPRRLAIRLLHEAQIATAPLLGLVLAEQGQNEPTDWLPLADDAALASAYAAVSSQGKAAWAIYRHRPPQPAPPVPEDFQTHPEILRLTASLAIKGVLQLRGWWWRNGTIIEQELDVRD